MLTLYINTILNILLRLVVNKMIEKTIEKFIQYGLKYLELDKEDVIYIRNNLMHLLNVSEPYEKNDVLITESDTPSSLFKELREDKDISIEDEELIMSIISPRPSLVTKEFNRLKEKSSKDACLYLYNLMIKNNYIKAEDIKKNISWKYEGLHNYLDITINLSKPEKKNTDIAKLLTFKSSTYPKCNLCFENVGNYGGGKIPARSNIRVIPVTLNNEEWFMQFSPYSYYNEHAIIINKTHTPMLITRSTFTKLLEFVDEYPNYFVGSNSDLPIVGGSILDHEHYQGGGELLPMMYAKDRYKIIGKGFKNSEISYLEWYNSTFLIKSTDIAETCDIAEDIYNNWLVYENVNSDIIPTDENGRHQAVTPIARKVGDTYYLYLILRNNRQSEKYPDGIFHAHPEYHNIKSEGIGLIEAMGRFILPPRLLDELSLIEGILSSSSYSVREIIEKHKELEKHLIFINNIIRTYGRHNTVDAAKEIIKIEVGKICEKILYNTSVFKNDINGQLTLFDFLNKMNYEVENED